MADLNSWLVQYLVIISKCCFRVKCGGWMGEGLETERQEKKVVREDGYLLGHNLFDLRFHITVHCLGFNTNKHRKTK